MHHSAVNTSTDQFRYLVQGEYVTFSIVQTDDGKRVASNVRGIQEGSLMCEVRSVSRTVKSEE